MQVRVLFFGMLRDLMGHPMDVLQLPEDATLGDLLDHYQTRTQPSGILPLQLRCR